jgi:oligogalacturonide lyase
MKRRQFVAGLTALAAGSSAGAAASQFSPVRRYLDASTDNEVYCLSDPDQEAWMSFPWNRTAARRQNFVLYSLGNGAGAEDGPQIHRLDLKGGLLKPLTNLPGIFPQAFALAPDDRTLYFAAGETLYATSTGNLAKPKELHRASSPEVWSNGFSLSEDGLNIAFIDEGKVQILNTRLSGKAAVRTVAEAGAGCHQPLAAKGGGVVWRKQQGGFWVSHPLAGAKALEVVVDGPTGPLVWNPDGRSFLFLRLSQERGVANALHEFSLETKRETLVGKTSQFVHFNRNGDSSVFVGASGSKAQPYVLLMLRVTRRELALCEHKASDPSKVAPVFSPSSNRIFFQSDRLGKQAIFSMLVDKLVEETLDDEANKKS